MTHDDWMRLLAPLIQGAVIVGGSLIAFVVSGLSAKAQQFLEQHKQATAAAVVANASTILDRAITSKVGAIALMVQNGQLDITNTTALRGVAAGMETDLLLKVPDAISILKPVAGAIAGAIADRVGTAVQINMTPLSVGANGVAASASNSLISSLHGDISSVPGLAGMSFGPTPPAGAILAP